MSDVSAARPPMSTTAPELRTTAEWPDPTPKMLTDPRFLTIWDVIKSWDVNVPAQYGGYCGATGNHVRAIFDALARLQAGSGITEEQVERACVAGYPKRAGYSEHVRGLTRVFVRQILEAASPLAPRQAPEGFVTVAIEPTEFMLKEGGFEGGVRDERTIRRIWSAMLAASPTAPGDTGGAWRPIETAPKGEIVWLFELHAMGGFMFAGVFNGMDWRNNLDQEIQHPTHWRSLPLPPPVSDGK